jgi:Tfp pilus assembly protein PilF
VCRADDYGSARNAALQTADLDFKNALAIWGSGTSKTAEKLLNEALTIREHELDPSDPKTAEVLERLGRLFYNRRQYTVAESYFRRALDIDMRSLSERNLATTVALGDLGASLREEHRFQEAETVIQREVTVRRQILDPNHPSIAASLDNLARLYVYEHRYDEAKSALKESLQIYRITFPGGSAIIESDQTLLEQAGQNQEIVRLRRRLEIPIGCLVAAYLMLIYGYETRISRYATERSAEVVRQQLLLIVMLYVLGAFSLCMPLFLFADPVTHVFRWNNANDLFGVGVCSLMAIGGLYLIWWTTIRLVVSNDEIDLTWLFGPTRSIRLDSVASAILSIGAKGSRFIVLTSNDSTAKKFSIPVSGFPVAARKKIEEVISKRTNIVDARTLISPEKRRKQSRRRLPF